jgi:FAD synthase
MLGRFQPWHDGHQELFKKAYEITGQVCIMVRIMDMDKNNPFSFDYISEKIVNSLKKDKFTYGENYDIIRVPNIINISYGRDVGYTFTEHDLGKDIHNISATEIRNKMEKENIVAK